MLIDWTDGVKFAAVVELVVVLGCCFPSPGSAVALLVWRWRALMPNAGVGAYYWEGGAAGARHGAVGAPIAPYEMMTSCHLQVDKLSPKSCYEDVVQVVGPHQLFLCHPRDGHLLHGFCHWSETDLPYSSEGSWARALVHRPR